MRSQVRIVRLPTMGGGVFSSHPACFAPYQDSFGNHCVYCITRCTLVFQFHVSRDSSIFFACARGDKNCHRWFHLVRRFVEFQCATILLKVEKKAGCAMKLVWAYLEARLSRLCQTTWPNLELMLAHPPIRPVRSLSWNAVGWRHPCDVSWTTGARATHLNEKHCTGCQHTGG